MNKYTAISVMWASPALASFINQDLGMMGYAMAAIGTLIVGMEELLK